MLVFNTGLCQLKRLIQREKREISRFLLLHRVNMSLFNKCYTGGTYF